MTGLPRRRRLQGRADDDLVSVPLGVAAQDLTAALLIGAASMIYLGGVFMRDWILLRVGGWLAWHWSTPTQTLRHEFSPGGWCRCCGASCRPARRSIGRDGIVPVLIQH